MGSKITLNGQLMFPSDYLSAFDCGGKDLTLTIKSIVKSSLPMRNGGKEEKSVLTFTNHEKKLVCNRTNAESIAEMYGPVAESWIGKSVTFFPTRTRMGRETVDCIRVREKVPSANGAPPTPEAPDRACS